MKKIILFLFAIATSINVFSQSTLITPGNQINKNSGPDLILTSNGVPELRGQRSAGTLAVPASTGTGANLLQINGYGHTGTSFAQSSQIRFVTSENWSATNRGSDIRFSTTKNGTTSFTEKMRLSGDGFLGVGTSTPLQNFVVTGTTPSILVGHNAADFASGNNAESGRIYFDEGVNTPAGRCGFEMHYDGSTNKFEINSGCTGFVNNLTILRTSGNVGIGTPNPTNKLDVNGIIRGNEVIVETGWADYVFKNDYKLKPLSEVENFIKTNQHLPNVPSAANIQEKGAHVAELMTKMMEKIEELTLYTINQQKEIDQLKQRLDEKK